MTSITIVLLQQTLNSVSYIAVNTDKDIHAHLNGNMHSKIGIIYM